VWRSPSPVERVPEGRERLGKSAGREVLQKNAQNLTVKDIQPDIILKI
jgi:hypothetical protein